MVRQKREKGSDLRDCERERYEWEYYIEKISRELEEEEEEIKRKRRFKDHFFKIYHFTLVCVICVRGFRLNTCVTTVVCLPLIKCKYLTRERMREWEWKIREKERKKDTCVDNMRMLFMISRFSVIEHLRFPLNSI